jgi:pimeloyl-ACP methyl ester carboxylesterase
MKKISGLACFCMLQLAFSITTLSQNFDKTPSIKLNVQSELPDSTSKKQLWKLRQKFELPLNIAQKQNNTTSNIDFIWGMYKSTSYTDRYYSSILDRSGNVIVVGSSGYSSNDNDAVIYKFDSIGNLLWNDVPAESSNIDEIFGVTTDFDENIYVTGKFYSSAFNGSISSNGSADAFIAKYNKNGVLQWARNAGGSENDYGCQLALDKTGNIYVVGYFRGIANWNQLSKTSSPQGDLFIAKYSNSGDIKWVKSGDIGVNNSLHGIGTDKAGNSYVSANFSGDVLFEGAPSASTAINGTDIFLITYDTNGNFRWIRTAGGNGDDGGNDTCIDEEGNVIITGYFSDNAKFENKMLTAHGSFDIFTAKYSSIGDLIWVKQFGGTGSQSAWAIGSDEKNNCYITGWFSGTGAFDNTTILSEGGTDSYVIKYDKNGNIVWVEPTLTGTGDQKSSGIFARNNKLITSGYYDDETQIQGYTFPYSDDNDAYLALFTQKEPKSTSVYVNPYLNISHSQLKAGESITFTGSQFSPVGKIDLYFYGPGSINPVIDYSINTSGYFNFTITIPWALKSGQYIATCTDKISSKTVTRTFQIIENIIPDNANTLRITEPNMSKIRHTGEQIIITWEDKVKFQSNPLYNYKHSYKIDYSLNGGTWIKIRDLSGLNPGYGTISNTISYTPTEEGKYIFRVTDNYDSNRVASTPELDIIGLKTDLQIEFKWDKSSYLTDQNVSPRGVAADGIARFYMVISNNNKLNPGIQYVKVSISDPDAIATSTQYLGKTCYCFPQNDNDFTLDGNNANSLSAWNNSSNINNTYWFWYVAPDDFARNESDWKKRSRNVLVSFEITFMDGSKQAIDKSIEIVRPPLMFVHGLIGTPGTWDSFKTGEDNQLFLQDDRFTYKKAVEMWPNSSFTENANLLYIYFRNFVTEMRVKGYASNRVDYVAHSMGGSVLRHAAENKNRYYCKANYTYGFVNKFITLHTPHDGSSFANFLEDFSNLGLSLSTKRTFLKMTTDWLLSYKELFKIDDFSMQIADAVADLRYKNGIKFSQTTIPSHMIGSAASCSEFNPTTTLLLTYLKYLMFPNKMYRDNCSVYSAYFNAMNYEGTFFNNSDAIVSASSQFSKYDFNSLPSNCTLIPGLMHNSLFGSSPTESDQVGKKIDTLLNTNVNSSSFSFLPPTSVHSSQVNIKQNTINRNVRVSEGKINLLFPTENTNYQVGDTINIRLKVDTVGLQGLALLFQGQHNLETPSTSEVEYQLVVTPEQIDKQTIMIIGGYTTTTDSTDIAIASAEVNIITSDSLIDFVVKPEIMFISEGGSKQPEFSAIYSRAISRIGSADSISVSIDDPSIVDFDHETKSFSGLKKGNTFATITYKRISKIVLLEIAHAEDSINDVSDIANLSLDKNSRLNLIVYPNPYCETFTIKYLLSTSSPTRLEIFTIEGVRIKTFMFGFQTSGWHQQLIEMENLPKGIYIYRFIAGDERHNGSIVKM